MFYYIVPSDTNAQNPNPIATTSTNVIRPVQVPTRFTSSPVQVPPTIQPSPVPVFRPIAPNVSNPTTSQNTSDSKPIIVQKYKVLTSPTVKVTQMFAKTRTADTKSARDAAAKQRLPEVNVARHNLRAVLGNVASKTTDKTTAAKEVPHFLPIAAKPITESMPQFQPISAKLVAEVQKTLDISVVEMPQVKRIPAKTAAKVPVFKPIASRAPAEVPVFKAIASKPTGDVPLAKSIASKPGTPVIVKNVFKVPQVKRDAETPVLKLICRTASKPGSSNIKAGDNVPLILSLETASKAQVPQAVTSATVAEVPLTKPAVSKYTAEVETSKPVTSKTDEVPPINQGPSTSTTEVNEAVSTADTEPLYSVLDDPPFADKRIEKEDLSREEYDEDLGIRTVKGKWTRERIQLVISFIEDFNAAPILKLPRTNAQYHYASKYEILHEDGRKFLIHKRQNPDDPAVKIVPCEEYYDVLMKVHLKTGHGGRDRMLQALKTHYHIPTAAVSSFTRHCKIFKKNFRSKLLNDSSSKKEIAPDIFDHRGIVDIIDMSDRPDGQYKWILHYQDNITKFSILRPLTSNIVEEISFELLKIYLEIGCPPILETKLGRGFTAALIQRLEMSWPDCKIINGIPEDKDIESVNDVIKRMLSMWMYENITTNWPIGIYFVQFKLNSAVNKSIEKKPFNALFGKGRKGLMNGFSVNNERFANITVEEDLANLLHDLDKKNNVMQESAHKNAEEEEEETEEDTAEEDATHEVHQQENHKQQEILTPVPNPQPTSNTIKEEPPEKDEDTDDPIKLSVHQQESHKQQEILTPVPNPPPTTNSIKEEPPENDEDTEQLKLSFVKLEEMHEPVNTDEQDLTFDRSLLSGSNDIIIFDDNMGEDIKEEDIEEDITVEDDEVQAKRMKMNDFFLNR